ncbi:MAG: hypothetical protein IT324_17570 [Anaerolineae bacterium]|nr:hypothetical protein [Anaerolineae bacterium]
MPERHSDDNYSSSSSSSYGSSNSSSGSSWSSRSSSHDNWDSSSDGSSSGGKSIFDYTAEDWIKTFIVFGLIGGIWLFATIGNSVRDANNKNATATSRAARTATTHAITISDLAIMHAALDAKIVEWRKVADRDVHHVSAAEAGFKPDFNTKEVVYGYCARDTFYVYVLNESRPGGFGADTEGYAYTPGSTPNNCVPDNWRIVKRDNAEGDWWFVTIRTYQATAIIRMTQFPQTPTLTATRTPTALPTPTRSKQ